MTIRSCWFNSSPEHSSYVTSMSMYLQRFQEQGYRGITVAVSGGADSSALLHMLCHSSANSLPLHVVHFNFRLRGDEANKDAEHVSQQARALHLPFHLYVVDEHDCHSKRGKSTQEWARDIRLRELQRLATKNTHVVALAHHRDDLVENVLYRLVKGTSPDKLLGMQTFSSPFWRPLLAVSRQKILAYCQRYRLSFRYDKSNDSLAYARNRIRLAVVPHLQKINDKAGEKIVAISEEIRDLYDEVEVELRSKYADYMSQKKIATSVIKELPSAKAKILLRLFLGKLTRQTLLKVYWAVLADERLILCLDQQRLLLLTAGYLRLTVPAREKVARKQQCQYALRSMQFHAALEPSASTEIVDGVALNADSNAKKSMHYSVCRPSAKQKVYWQGQHWYFKELMRKMRVDFAGSKHWYLRKNHSVKQRDSVLVNSSVTRNN